MKTLTSQDQITKIKAIYDAFESGIIPRLDEHEVNPGLARESRENYLYFLLSCTINFRRSSTALWKASLATWNDPATNYLFFPETSTRKAFSEIQRDMVKHKLAIQTNKHPEIWLKISKTLNEHYDNDPRKILAEGEYRIAKIIPLIQKTKKHLFPYLSGIKLSNYSMAILSNYTDANFIDAYNLSIIPDTHIIKSSIQLGIVGLNASPQDVEDRWRPILKQIKILPQKMHTALWYWSRHNFPEVY